MQLAGDRRREKDAEQVECRLKFGTAPTLCPRNTIAAARIASRMLVTCIALFSTDLKPRRFPIMF
jgi:hypothetical protein